MKAACVPASGTAGTNGAMPGSSSTVTARAEADTHHRRRRGLAQSRQQSNRRTDARHHQHEGERPRRQRGEQRGIVAGHEPPMAIRRSSSAWV